VASRHTWHGTLVAMCGAAPGAPTPRSVRRIDGPRYRAGSERPTAEPASSGYPVGSGTGAFGPAPPEPADSASGGYRGGSGEPTTFSEVQEADPPGEEAVDLRVDRRGSRDPVQP